MVLQVVMDSQMVTPIVIIVVEEAEAARKENNSYL
jgi:hypothetical protein